MFNSTQQLSKQRNKHKFDKQIVINMPLRIHVLHYRNITMFIFNLKMLNRFFSNFKIRGIFKFCYLVALSLRPIYTDKSIGIASINICPKIQKLRVKIKILGHILHFIQVCGTFFYSFSNRNCFRNHRQQRN